MFPKSVCRQNERGQRRGQAIAFTRRLLTRWKMGERQGLWDEAVMAMHKRGQKRSKDRLTEQREADVCRLLSLGRPGQVAKRLVSPGLAETNDLVLQKLLAKFPPNPDNIAPRPIPAQPPAPELPLELAFKSLQSFPIGSGPGPDSLRVDFLKGVIGQSLDSEVLQVLRAFLQILADAEVPDMLQPWLAGGSLVGVGKVDKSGRPIALDRDARPIVMGQVFHELAFKCNFRFDAEGIKTRLLPHQLAVAIAGGPEVLVHFTRNWIAQNKGKEDMILLQKDINNGFNTVLPSILLEECRQYAPASSRFATLCYASASHLIYEGSTYTSARRQQGCPMMTALFCLVRKRHAEEVVAATGIILPFQPEYADDGFCGGRIQDVDRYFGEESRLAAKFGLKYDLSQCTDYLLSGDHFRGDLSGFQELGIQIRTDCDIQILKAPISGQ